MNTQRLLGNLDRLETVDQLNSDSNVTVEPIRVNQVGLSVAPTIYVYKITSDIVAAGSAINTVIVTSSSPLVGDIISFTSGSMSGLEYKIKKVVGTTATLCENLPQIASAGTTFDLLRYKYPVVESDGSTTATIINTPDNPVFTNAATAFGTATNSQVALTPLTPTLILAANPDRKFANISNASGSLMSIQLGNSTGLVSTQVGIPVPTGSYYELKGDNLYTGPVYGYTVSNTVTLSVVEGTP